MIKVFAKEIFFQLLRIKSYLITKNEVSIFINQWKSIYSKAYKKNKKNKSALFVTGYGLGSHYLTIEPIIMSGLISRGVSVSSLICGKSLPCCEFNIVGNNIPSVSKEFLRGFSKKSNENLCDNCVSNVKKNYNNLDIDLFELNKYINEDDHKEAFLISEEITVNNFRNYIYKGIKVGEEAFSSILRVTFKGEVEDNDKNLFLAKRYVASGILTVKGYIKAFKMIKPDRIVCIHGVYQTHGLAVKVARKLEIPIIVMGGGGIRKNTVVVCHDETYHNQLVHENTNKWEDYKLTQNEINKTLNYANLKKNSGNGADYLSYHPNPIENRDYLYSNYNIDKSKKIVSIYTNVVWDAQIYYSENVFNNIFNWIYYTIEHLGKNENIYQFVRIHPAEAKGGGLPCNQPMKKEILNYFKNNLPENLRIIDPEDNLSSYLLAQESTANIIYGTKMGLEIGLMKKPLIVCGETFSRGKGYSIDIKSIKEYKDLIENIHDYNFASNQEKWYKNAIRYANYLYFRRMLDLPYDKSTNKILFNSLDSIKKGQNKSIDLICNGIIDLQDFHFK